MKHALAVIVLAACTSTHAPAPLTAAAPAIDPALANTIREVADHYLAWGRVDAVPRQAPALCAAVAPHPDGQLRRSAATDGPHGEKLYYLYASDRDAYLNNRAGAGFQIVKESFADAGGKTGAPTGLFVMARVESGETDAGWIYGTVVDGQVTSAGRVATCMGCHVDAPHDRLFGLRIVENENAR